MENSNNYPRTYPGFQYFPPPTAWIDPNSVSSDDDNTPTWVIVGAVIVAVILCGFLFYYIWRREKKIWKKAALASASTPKKDPTPTKVTPPKTDPPKDTTQKKDVAQPPKTLPMVFPSSYPGDCPACGHRGGLYSFSYACPQCKCKMEYNLVYPGKK